MHHSSYRKAIKYFAVTSSISIGLGMTMAFGIVGCGGGGGGGGGVDPSTSRNPDVVTPPPPVVTPPPPVVTPPPPVVTPPPPVVTPPPPVQQPAPDTYFASNSATFSRLGAWSTRGPFHLDRNQSFEFRCASDFQIQAAIFSPDQLDAFKNNRDFTSFSLFDRTYGTQSVTLGPGDYYVGIRNMVDRSNEWGYELDLPMSIPGFRFRDVYLQDIGSVSPNGGRYSRPFTIQSGFRYLMDGTNSGMDFFIMDASEIAKFSSEAGFDYRAQYSGLNDGSQPGFYELRLPAGDYYLAFRNRNGVAKTFTYDLDRFVSSTNSAAVLPKAGHVMPRVMPLSAQ